MQRISMRAAWLLVAVAHPAVARDLPVPADKGWQHAASGVVLTAKIDGFSRTSLTDATDSEHDVAANFEDAAQGVSATIYIFHPAVDDVALWFDRSRVALEQRDIFRHASPASADPIAFAVPGSSTASSLRQTYAVPAGVFRSTTVSVTPVGDWLVVIRLSARTLTAGALDTRWSRFIAAIRWPKEIAPAPVAVPIRECATPLVFGKAKPARTNGTDMLINVILGSALTTKAATAKTDDARPADRPVWCRQGPGSAAFGVYRSDPTAPRYTIGLSDAGRVVHVAPSLSAQIAKGTDYGVTLIDIDDSSRTFGPFTAMPRPEQVYDEIAHGSATASVSGKTITLDTSTFK